MMWMKKKDDESMTMQRRGSTFALRRRDPSCLDSFTLVRLCSCDAGDDDDGEDDNDDDDTTADEDSLTPTRNQVPGRVRVCIHCYLVNPCRSPFPGCWVPSLPMWRIRHLDFQLVQYLHGIWYIPGTYLVQWYIGTTNTSEQAARSLFTSDAQDVGRLA